jgi:hypothetical protein
VRPNVRQLQQDRPKGLRPMTNCMTQHTAQRITYDTHATTAHNTRYTLLVRGHALSACWGGWRGGCTEACGPSLLGFFIAS